MQRNANYKYKYRCDGNDFPYVLIDMADLSQRRISHEQTSWVDHTMIVRQQECHLLYCEFAYVMKIHEQS